MESAGKDNFEYKLGRFLNRPYVKLVEIVTFIFAFLGILISIIQFNQGNDDRKRAQDVALKDAISKSWEIMTIEAPGNVGKKDALEFLNSNRIKLQAIDVSCERVGGLYDNEGNCYRGAFLDDLNLDDANLSGANFSGSNLVGSSFKNAYLAGVNFSTSEIPLSNFADTNLFGAKFNNARIYKVNFINSNISHTDFSDAKYVSSANFTNAWAWSDFPPKGLPENIVFELCEPGENSEKRGTSPMDEKLIFISGPKPDNCNLKTTSELSSKGKIDD